MQAKCALMLLEYSFLVPHREQKIITGSSENTTDMYKTNFTEGIHLFVLLCFVVVYL